MSACEGSVRFQDGSSDGARGASGPRGYDPDDERVSRARLARAGRSLGQDLEHVVCQLEEAAFSGFIPEKRVLQRRCILQIRDSLLHLSEGRMCL